MANIKKPKTPPEPPTFEKLKRGEVFALTSEQQPNQRFLLKLEEPCINPNRNNMEVNAVDLELGRGVCIQPTVPVTVYPDAEIALEPPTTR